jgi:hypothetical protein
MGVRITTKTTRPSQSLRACHPKIKLGQSTSALSRLNLGSEVVDLVKDPNVAGPLTRSTTQKSKLDRTLDQTSLQA